MVIRVRSTHQWPPEFRSPVAPRMEMNGYPIIRMERDLELASRPSSGELSIVVLGDKAGVTVLL